MEAMGVVVLVGSRNPGCRAANRIRKEPNASSFNSVLEGNLDERKNVLAKVGRDSEQRGGEVQRGNIDKSK